MSRSLAPAAPQRRRRSRRPLAWLLGASLAAALAALGLGVETAPRAPVGAPDAAAARAARDAGETLRGFLGGEGPEGRLRLSVAEIDALFASAGRLAPGFGAAVTPTEGGIAMAASVGAPHLPWGLWANLRLGLAADAGGLRIVSARLGRLPLPAGLAQAALIRGADRVVAPGLAEAALAGVVGLEASGGVVEAELAFTPEDRAALVERLRAALSLSAGGEDARPIWVQLYWLDRAGDEGVLPKRGTALPYLRYAVTRAEREARRSPEMSDRDHLIAALLALGVYCGEPALGPAIGVSLSDTMRGERNHCGGTALAGRDDLKRHFIVSAALYAASTGDAALGIGEVKELIDSGSGGSGFSFDDMAANLAGARFAQVFLEAPRPDWPELLARIGAESDLLPETRDLPSGLSEAEFRAQFGAMDSPAYAALLAEIGRRIDALPLHRRGDNAVLSR